MKEIVESGEIENRYYSKLVLDNSSDYIIDNELYSIYRKGIEIISVPLWNEPSKNTYDKFVGENWKYNLPRIYTLYKLNGYKNSKSILPFMKYQYKMTDDKFEKLKTQYNRFQKVLELSNVVSFSYNPPYNVESREIEELFCDDGNYHIEKRMVYSTQDKIRLKKNGEYNERYKKLKKKIISAAVVYKEQIKNLEFNKDDLSVKKINDILQILKRYFNEKYIIKETRYIILNKERGWKSLFYTNKEYKFLSVNYYNHKKPEDKKRMIEIEREYLNKGIGLLKEEQNENLINYGITWLQDKVKITNQGLSGVTGLSKPTISKYRKKNWRDDNEKLF